MLSDLTSVGTLFAFVLVCLGVMILRLRMPDAPRKFKVPFGPFLIPSLGALTSLLLIVVAKPSTLYRLVGWMFVGMIIYVFYGRRHSIANNPSRKKVTSPDTAHSSTDTMEMTLFDDAP